MNNKVILCATAILGIYFTTSANPAVKYGYIEKVKSVMSGLLGAKEKGVAVPKGEEIGNAELIKQSQLQFPEDSDQRSYDEEEEAIPLKNGRFANEPFVSQSEEPALMAIAGRVAQSIDLAELTIIFRDAYNLMNEISAKGYATKMDIAKYDVGHKRFVNAVEKFEAAIGSELAVYAKNRMGMDIDHLDAESEEKRIALQNAGKFILVRAQSLIEADAGFNTYVGFVKGFWRDRENCRKQGIIRIGRENSIEFLKVKKSGGGSKTSSPQNGSMEEAYKGIGYDKFDLGL